MHVRPTIRLFLTAVTITALASVALVGATVAQQGGQDPPKAALQQVIRDSGANDATIDTLGFIPVLGSTPFLGLAVLAGASLVADSNYVRSSDSPFVRSLRQNPLIRSARKYSNPWVIAFLALMALAHFVLSSHQVLNLVGMPLKKVEAIAALVVLPVLVAGFSAAPIESSLNGPAHMLAGFVPTLTWQSALLICGMLLALVAVIAVRLALEVLIWLSPIPFLDAIFQILKHGITFGLIGLYFTSPVAAAIVAGVIVAICLLVLPWAVRLVRFAYLIVANPLLSKISTRFTPRLVEKERLPDDLLDVTLACRGAVLKARKPRRFKKHAPVMVVRSGDQLLLVGKRFFRHKRRELLESGERVVIGRRLTCIELRVINSDGKTLDRIAFSHALRPNIPQLCTVLGGEDMGSFGKMQAWLDRLTGHSEQAGGQASHLS